MRLFSQSVNARKARLAFSRERKQPLPGQSHARKQRPDFHNGGGAL